MSLRDYMRERYGNWREDLSPDSGWPTFFDECPAQDFEVIPATLEIAADAQVWPGRRGNPHQGAPAGAHICRAFEGIEPEGVRVVVLGQDPYPDIAQTTGRAFEDGAWTGARTEEMAGSLKSLMLAVLATCDGHADLFRTGSWPEVRKQIVDGELVFPAIRDHFNSLAGQGVLFVNTAWTRTRDEDLAAHRSLWKPVVDYMLRKLAKEDQPVIFLLLGNDAKKGFCAADPVCNRSAIVDSAHPGRSRFFGSRNPFERVNHALVELNTNPVIWWQDPLSTPA